MLKSHIKSSSSIHPIKTRKSIQAAQTPSESRRYSKASFNPELSSKTHLSIFLTYAETSLNLLIPTTLINYKILNKAILFYQKEGKLCMENHSSAHSRFFELCQESDFTKYKHPKFIEYTPTGIWLYSKEEEVMRNQSNIDMSLLQQFVHADKKCVKKMRVLWDRDKGFSYWSVNSNQELPKTQWFREECLAKGQSSAYMFKVKQYNYAGRLLKTSLSPFNLYSSKLKTAVKKKVATENLGSKSCTFLRRDTTRRFSSFTNLYFAKQSDQTTSASYEILTKFPRLESLIQDFFEIFDRWSENLGCQLVNDASFDFIEDTKGKFFLVGCKLSKIETDTFLQSINFRRTTQNGNILVEEVKRAEELKTEQMKYEKQILEIKERLENLKCTPAAVVDFDKSLVISLYKTLPITSEPTSQSTRDRRLSPIVHLYDSTINKVRELKKRSNNNSFQSPKIEEIFHEIIDHLSFSDHFHLQMQQPSKIQLLKDLVTDCIQEQLSKSTTQQIKDLGVNRKNFEDFIVTFNDVFSQHYEDSIKDSLIEKLIEFSGF